MPLHLYKDVYASGTMPADWTPAQGGALKYPVRNKAVAAYLRTLFAGRWKKVIKYGDVGEVHYFEHESGRVAGVKYFPKD